MSIRRYNLFHLLSVDQGRPGKGVSMQEEESVECRKVRVLAERASLPSFPWSSTSLFSKEVALYLYVCVYIHVNIPEHTTKVIG